MHTCILYFSIVYVCIVGKLAKPGNSKKILAKNYLLTLFVAKQQYKLNLFYDLENRFFLYYLACSCKKAAHCDTSTKIDIRGLWVMWTNK